MTEFTELYKNLSNSELLKIIAESDKYNPIAVETAKTEIDSRKLSTEELNQAKTEINKQEEKKKLEIEKRKRQEGKIKENASTLFDTINPIQNGIQTPEKIIRLTTLIFSGIAVYRIFKEFGMLRYMFTDSGAKWDLSMVEYFFHLIVLPLAAFLFWKRKKSGWILLSIFLTYSAITVIGLFLMNIGRQPSGIPALESLFPTVSPITYIMTLIFFGGTLWLISKEEIRNIYKISKQTMFLTIGLTIAVNVIYMYSIIG
ncbi:hypothetical protein [uncultured Aquimarina sp.]|uniref:hypothetical protein n=1 Tax=uncultured Aquimarina sp. TaxID=575652 RepID=UPI002626B28E|nr:hypothetical protein [uncultured Aquimarina sp.]